MNANVLRSTLLSICLTSFSQAQTSPFPALAAARAEAVTTGFAMKGDAPGWLFLRDDVLHASKGEFWKATPSPAAAALPLITKFRETLAAAGVTLILAPVPSKAAIYPDKLAKGTAPDAAPSFAPFLESLKATGAIVVDLEAPFRAARDQTPVFCATDSHWSPAGLALAAKTIMAVPALTALAKPGAYLTSAPESVTITGDLAASPGLEKTPPETLTLTKIGTGSATAPVPVPAAATSPVILLGDSHTMVFTDGASLGMHLQGSGLRDQLQAQLGFPLIQLSNQNSGGTGARRLFNQRLQANPAYLKDVKALIWVFSIREFTLGRWR